MGQLLDYLDDSGLAKNTVVIYSSDQGFYLGEHGWFDKRFMYDESYRTPLIIRWPGQTKSGSVNSQLVSNLDFAETFLDLAGEQIPMICKVHRWFPFSKDKSPRIGEKITTIITTNSRLAHGSAPWGRLRWTLQTHVFLRHRRMGALRP